jgi:hypothetical protein
MTGVPRHTATNRKHYNNITANAREHPGVHRKQPTKKDKDKRLHVLICGGFQKKPQKKGKKGTYSSVYATVVDIQIHIFFSLQQQPVLA